MSGTVTELCVESMQCAGRVKVLTEHYQQLPDGSLLEVKPLLEPEKPLPMPQADVIPVQGMDQIALRYRGCTAWSHPTNMLHPGTEMAVVRCCLHLCGCIACRVLTSGALHTSSRTRTSALLSRKALLPQLLEISIVQSFRSIYSLSCVAARGQPFWSGLSIGAHQ